MDYQTSIREYNNARILSLLRCRFPLSRAEISRHTNLNRSTVSSIIDELLGAGFVREMGLRQISTGRPSIMLEIDPEHHNVIGLDIQPDAAVIVLADLLGEIIWQGNVPFAELQTSLKTAVDIAFSRASHFHLTPAGIGVAVMGNPSEAAIHDALDSLSIRSSLPIIVEGQTRAAAIGQYYLGQAHGVENFIYLTDVEGPQAVFTINGRIHRGSTDQAGRIAHLSVGAMGLPCRCGSKGCWNPRVSPEAIARRLQTDQPFEKIVASAKTGNGQAQSEIHAMCQALGRGISHIVRIVDPNLIVLGGHLGCLKAEYLQMIHDTVLNSDSQHLWNDINIVLTEEEEKSHYAGAISLVLNHLYQDLTI